MRKIFLTSLFALAALGVVDILPAAMLGGIALWATGCLKPEEVFEADWSGRTRTLPVELVAAVVVGLALVVLGVGLALVCLPEPAAACGRPKSAWPRSRRSWTRSSGCSRIRPCTAMTAAPATPVPLFRTILALSVVWRKYWPSERNKPPSIRTEYAT